MKREEWESKGCSWFKKIRLERKKKHQTFNPSNFDTFKNSNCRNELVICTNPLFFPLRREAKWNWAALVRRWSSSSFISQLVKITRSMPDVTALSSRPVATYFIRNSQGYLWSRALLGKSILQLTGTTTVRGRVGVNLDRRGWVFWHVILDAEAEKLKCACVICHPHTLSISDCCSAHDLFWMHKLKPWCKTTSKTEVHLWVKHVLLIKKKQCTDRIFTGSFILFSFPHQGPGIARVHLLAYHFQYHFNRLRFIDYGLAQATQLFNFLLSDIPVHHLLATVTSLLDRNLFLFLKLWNKTTFHLFKYED